MEQEPQITKTPQPNPALESKQAPVFPQEQKEEKPIGEEHHNFLWLIVALLIVAGALFVYMQLGNYGSGNVGNNTELECVNLDVAQGENKIPAGFATGIPINIEGITESCIETDKSTGAVMYTVVFNTNESDSAETDAYADIQDYLIEEGYFFDQEKTIEPEGIIYASKVESVVSAVIKPVEKYAVVRLIYIKHPEPKVPEGFSEN